MSLTMAKIKLGSLISEASGSLGGHTLQHSKGGMQLRTKPVPANNPTAGQRLIRSIMPGAQDDWRGLPIAIKRMWNEAAPGKLSGHSYFIREYHTPLFFTPCWGTARDIPDPTHTGTVTGCIPSNDQYNRSNKSLYFDGTDDGVVFPSKLLVSSALPFTISFWVYTTAWKNQYSVWCGFQSNQVNPFTIWFCGVFGSYGNINMGALNGWYRIKVNQNIASWLLQKWAKIVVTYNGLGSLTLANFNVYVNTIKMPLSLSSSYATLPNITQYSIPSAVHRPNGKLCQVRLYQELLPSTYFNLL